MITINANTKISSLIKQSPYALEAIVSLSPKFKKLRNPILRKMIAARTSIAMASKIGGCSLDDFFDKLKSLGFDIENTPVKLGIDHENKPVPGFVKDLSADKIVELDVRSLIETGKDPLNIIVQKVHALGAGSVLKIINSFEPTPLIILLGKKGFESYSEEINNEQVNTFFYRKSDKPLFVENGESDDTKDWDEIANRFKNNLQTIDVRELEMPLPMHAIMNAIKKLPNGNALFVYHKRIPVFLLPELAEQQFSYRIKEISDGEVHLLIYKT